MSDDHRSILLTRGKVAIVDAELYDELARWKWQAIQPRAGGAWYAKRRSTLAERALWCAGSIVLMHRAVLGLGATSTPLIDHRNGDGLDNRRTNLRQASPSNNAHNRQRAAAHSQSGVLGVFWDRQRGAWKAYVRVMGRQHFIGRFDSLAEAARERANAAHRITEGFCPGAEGAA